MGSCNPLLATEAHLLHVDQVPRHDTRVVGLPTSSGSGLRSTRARPAHCHHCGASRSRKDDDCKIVADHFDKAVCIESDWFWTTVVRGFVPPWRSDADAQNRVILRAVASAAAAMATGYAVVLDGVFGPWYLDIVLEQLDVVGARADYFILRPSREVALARATSRAGDERVPGHPALTDEGPILHMWDQFADVGIYEDRVIDNTEMSAEEAAALIYQAVSATT